MTGNTEVSSSSDSGVALASNGKGDDEPYFGAGLVNPALPTSSRIRRSGDRCRHEFGRSLPWGFVFGETGLGLTLQQKSLRAESLHDA